MPDFAMISAGEQRHFVMRSQRACNTLGDITMASYHIDTMYTDILQQNWLCIGYSCTQLTNLGMTCLVMDNPVAFTDPATCLGGISGGQLHQVWITICIFVIHLSSTYVCGCRCWLSSSLCKLIQIMWRMASLITFSPLGYRMLLHHQAVLYIHPPIINQAISLSSASGLSPIHFHLVRICISFGPPSNSKN